MADSERIVTIDGVEHHFPGDDTDAEISAALKAVPASNADAAPKAKTWSSVALPLATAGKAVPLGAKAAMEVATNPAVPRVGAAIGRVVGAVAPVVVGAEEEGPLGALVGLTAAAKGSWAGGKTGWFTGKLAQATARPVARVLDKVAPYAQALTTLSGAQAYNELSQTADPDRKDIGTLGVGPTQQIPQAFLDYLAGKGKAKDAIDALVKNGWSQSQATRAVMNQKVKGH